MTKVFCDVCKSECNYYYNYMKTFSGKDNNYLLQQQALANASQNSTIKPEHFCLPCLIKHLSELK